MREWTEEEIRDAHALSRRIAEMDRIALEEERERFWREAKERPEFMDGLRRGLMRGVMSICELLGVDFTDPRVMRIQDLDAAELEALRQQLMKLRAWPE